MRSFTIKPTKIETFYDFRCPSCNTQIYKTLGEIKYHKWDICYCGAQLIFDLPEEKSIIEKKIDNKIKKEVISNKEESVLYSSQNKSKSIPIKPVEIKKKKYDLDGYVKLLKSLGMKVGPAKVLIKQLIGLGLDPLDEANFTTELLKNI